MFRILRKESKFSSLRSSRPLALGEAIESFFKSNQLENKFDETKLINAWESLMGTTIASRTTKIELKKKILYVRVNSAPLKNELLLSKTKIAELVNKFLNKQTVEEVIIQ